MEHPHIIPCSMFHEFSRSQVISLLACEGVPYLFAEACQPKLVVEQLGKPRFDRRLSAVLCFGTGTVAALDKRGGMDGDA